MKTCKISVILLLSFFLSACGQVEGEKSSSQISSSTESQGQFVADYDWIMPEFTFINQDGVEVGLSDLKGEAWLANFVFTNCSSVCPPMTFNTAKLQQKMSEEGLNNHIISFSVDPARDTPEVLKEYAKKFEVDFTNWHFLTGYDQEDIRMIAKACKTLAEQEEGTDQFIHSTKLFLIDKDGMIVKGYDSLKLPNEEIIADLKLLES